MSDDRLITWGHNGKLLGYPPCCIEFFLKRGANLLATGQEGEYSLDQNQENITKLDTGFIPCPICAAKVACGMPLELLIKDRDPSLPPFPHA